MTHKGLNACTVRSASQRESEIDKIPLGMTVSVLMENEAKDLPHA